MESMNNETASMDLLALVYRIEIVALPLLILFGSICNIITFIVMRRRRMRVSSTCFYMAALAVTDTLVLWTGCLNQWFYLIHIPTLLVKSNFFCKLLPFLFVFFADASVWIIVCMSFERYFAVSRPLSASQTCTTRRAKWVLVTMLTVFVLIDGHFLLTLELEVIDGQYRACHPKRWARHFVGKIFVFIDALKYSAIPFCILLILSVLIIQRVFRAEGISAQLQNLRQLHRYRHYSSSSSPNSTKGRSPSLATAHISMMSNNTRVGRRVTFMLLSVSIAFCVFSAPMSLMQIVQSISQPGYRETPLAIGKAVAELCQYVNHSCNFFLYALTGRVFRREFVRLFFPNRFGGGSAGGGVPNGTKRVLVPKAGHSSTRRGSVYSFDNNRGTVNDTSLRRNPRRLTTFYPLQCDTRNRSYPFHYNHSFTSKSPLLAHSSPLLINEHQRAGYNKRSGSLATHSGSGSPLAALWNIFDRRKERDASGDGPFLFVNVLRPNKAVPSSV